MRRCYLQSALFILLAAPTVFAADPIVLDRIAVITGKHAIKTSDIERDLRVTDFLNRAPLTLTADARRKSADRLVDQTIIRDEISTGDYSRATDAEAENMLNQLRKDRFAGSDQRMRDELSRYGLTEPELKDALLWQLTVLSFIDERFRPAVNITEDAVKTYYDAHQADLKRQYPRDSSLATISPALQTQLEEEQVDKLFDQWVADQRKAARVTYRNEAFQ